MLSERQRQKRREKKAQRRRAKLKTKPATRADDPVVVFGTGLPKMSEMIVEFAEPFLTTLPETEEAWKDGLSIAAIVWNGIVANESSEVIVAQLRRGIDPSVDVVELVRVLTERKAALFPDDDRFIFGLETKEREDRIDVSAVSGFAR
jgi:hypothetical protein